MEYTVHLNDIFNDIEVKSNETVILKIYILMVVYMKIVR